MVVKNKTNEQIQNQNSVNERLTKEEQFGLSEKKFKILYSNRNIRRKMPGDVVLAYKYFMDKLTPEQ